MVMQQQLTDPPHQAALQTPFAVRNEENLAVSAELQARRS
jgi:hypothetical protein